MRPRWTTHLSLARTALPFISALAIVFAVYGAVPFVTLPTLGQALWISSYALSFANHGWPSILAHDFGIPDAARIAFGLSGAVVESALLVTTPLGVADAYNVTIAGFLALAMWGAMRYALSLGARRSHALALATVWATMPLVWMHAGYSMLSIGIALLPLYLWTTQSLCDVAATGRATTVAACGTAFVALACVAAFTDGYTFVMFGVGAGVQFVAQLALRRSTSIRVLAIGLPFYMTGFGMAYVLYARFVGTHDFAADPISVFRGFGVDVTMLLQPTEGLLWIWDVLRVSTPRSDVAFYGDASVWLTTFSAPVILVGLAGFKLTANKARAVPLLALGILATYLAFGPSLKIDSQRPVTDREAGNFQVSMPPELAVGPTGTAWLSAHVPGFSSMRASYRWTALSSLAFWALFVLLIAELSTRGRHKTAWLLLAAMLISNLPNPEVDITASDAHIDERDVLLHAPIRFREQFTMLDRSIVTDFQHDAPKGGVTVFFPQGNDFLAAYLATKSGTRTYNIGGDKNVALASSQWPPSISTLFASDLATLPANIEHTLESGDANAVVISYVDLLWNAHQWPPSPSELAGARTRYAQVLDYLSRHPRLIVKNRPYYALIEMRD